MSKKFVGQRQWVREILTRFAALEKEQPDSRTVEPEWPVWVENLWLCLSGISYPGTKFKSMKKWKSRDLGKFLGRHYAGEHLISGEVPLSPQVLREGDLFSAWAEGKIKDKNPHAKMDELIKQAEQAQQEWQPKFKRFMQEVLASACERPYVEAAAFFQAFGKAIVMKPDEFITERTMGVGDKICWTMIMMWPRIERMESVAQLHRVFEQALRPKGITVKYKRIEKLCQRIKLKFKGPGRPQGRKNSDKLLGAPGVY